MYIDSIWVLSEEKVLVTFHHSVSRFNSTNATKVCLIHLKIVEMVNFMLMCFLTTIEIKTFWFLD